MLDCQSKLQAGEASENSWRAQPEIGPLVSLVKTVESDRLCSAPIISQSQVPQKGGCLSKSHRAGFSLPLACKAFFLHHIYGALSTQR
jgi:hypothetical protein